MKLDAGTLLDISALVEKCRSERDSYKRLKILCLINTMLPYTKQLHIPAFLTEDYVDRALHEIEKALKSYY